MAKIKFIYFDVGNVLNEYEGSFDETINKFNLASDDFMDFWFEYEDDLTRGKITPEIFWQKAIKRFNLKNGDKYNFPDSWASGYTPQIKMHEFVKKIKGKYRIGLLTNHYIGMLDRSIKKGKVPDLNYEVKVTSYETGYRKPEKEIYKIATKKAGVLPQEILFIDDIEKFIIGAKDAGWNTFHFNMENIEETVLKLEKLLL